MEKNTILQTVMAEHNDGNDRFRLGIIVETENNDMDVIAAIRAAAGEFLQTERGKAAIAENAGDFNYGDMVASVPDEICLRHGFKIVDTFITELIVDHNESLIPEDLKED